MKRALIVGFILTVIVMIAGGYIKEDRTQAQIESNIQSWNITTWETVEMTTWAP